MNNKGQSLVLFVIILPLIFIIGVFVFDLSNLYSEKSKLDNIAYDALYYERTNHQTVSKASSLVYKNDQNIKIDEFTDDSICLSKDTEPILGGILGKEKYTLKTCYEARIYNSILRIEKKDD